MTSVLIIDCTQKPYNGADHAQKPLGGIERTIVQLSQALAQKGIDVAVWNQTELPVHHNNVTWIPQDRPDLLKPCDTVIVCNDPHYFDTYAKATGHRDFKPILWQHNPLFIEKAFLKGRILPMLRWKPVGVFLSQSHLESTSFLFRYRQKVIIPHGLEDEVLSYPANDNPRKKIAVFFSQRYRGLDRLVDLWRKDIHPAHPDAEFRIYAAPCTDLQGPGIRFMGRQNKADLIDSLQEARVALIPGHSDETFCLAAAESLALGIPVLTYGTGALAERVRDGVDGFIVENEQSYAQKLKDIFTDDFLWHKLRANAYSTPDRKNWAAIADLWVPLI